MTTRFEREYTQQKLLGSFLLGASFPRRDNPTTVKLHPFWVLLDSMILLQLASNPIGHVLYMVTSCTYPAASFYIVF